MESTLLTIGGFYILCLSVFHLAFWKIFDWKTDLKNLKFINRQVMPLLNLCLTFLFIAFALLSFFYQDDLLTTDLGQVVILIIFSLLLFRFFLQFVYFGFNKKSNGFAAIIFLGVLIYGTVFFNIY